MEEADDSEAEGPVEGGWGCEKAKRLPELEPWRDLRLETGSGGDNSGDVTAAEVLMAMETGKVTGSSTGSVELDRF